MKKWLWVIGIIALLLGLAFVIAFNWAGTGFGGKTLWDWLSLLGVLAIPVVVGFGAVWYTARQTRASETMAEQQRKTELARADQEHKTELEIAADNQREAALQAYIDKMSELLLANNLRQSLEGDEVRNIARVRTLTVLRRLDSNRKASVLQFLHESELIDKDKCIVDLQGADLSFAHLSHAVLNRRSTTEDKLIIMNAANLSEVNLVGANLSGASLAENCLYNADLSGSDLNRADLRRANLDSATLNKAILDKANLNQSDLSFVNLVRARLVGTNLSGAKLLGADLSEANLGGANLRETNLTEANLSGANLNGVEGITGEQLKSANSLKGATMPDGSKHP